MITIEHNISTEFPYVFAGVPLMLTAVIGENDIPEGATCARIAYSVKANRKYMYYCLITNGASVSIDVSSALMAEFMRLNAFRHPEPAPAIEFSIVYKVDYIQAGEIVISYDYPVIDKGYALPGKPMEMDALSDLRGLVTAPLSLRSACLEPRAVGDSIFSWQLDLNTKYIWPSVSVVAADSDIRGVVVSAEPRQEFFFLNSFGLLDSISALDYRKESLEVKKESFYEAAASPLSIAEVPRMRVQSAKSNITFSSGPVTHELVNLWNAFFLAPLVWMIKGGKRIPVLVETESVTMSDRTAASVIMEYKFNVVIKK